MYAEAPYYVYDGKMIEDACGCLRRALLGFDFLYSVKANPFDPVMRLIAERRKLRLYLISLVVLQSGSSGSVPDYRRWTMD